MKRLAIFPLALLLILSLVGCANNNDTNNDNGNGTNDQNNTSNNTTTGESATGSNDVNNNDLTNDNGKSKVEVADDAADKIAALDEVDSANVLVTNNNAYVGVVLNEGIEENDEMKNKIADEVRSVNSEFNNVYVSFNPDVADRFTEYGDQIRSGEPVEGFFEEVMTSIDRMFPEAK
ncbi:YhcN/YlaJ family sporulation lipoprotein [Sporosarcina koreensis]|uniref:YhcN/YlaJ family sporulation lipoprotein n=1 Tax=Bacillales TaxID=1385 RepID=UPI000751EDB3|nr:YhcN/YlaJ family sporulation lipoprotein [Sporosarcina koreensis]